MKILGNRVYLVLPEMKEYKVTVPDETKKKLQEELLQKTEQLEIYDMGPGMGEGKALMETIRRKDKVYVDPNKLRLCPIFNIEGINVVVVSVFDISHVW